MSRMTFAGPYRNPTESWIVKPVRGGFGIFIRETERTKTGGIPADRRHTSRKVFAEAEDAAEWIEGTREHFEECYDEYLEEHGSEIARMERYEAHRNEF